MNIQRVFRIMTTAVVLTTLFLGAGPAFAQSGDNSIQVVTPYWQAGSPNSGQVYTFIAISHPSLSQMHSQIGVRATAFLGDGVATNLYGSAVDFTVTAGTTHRLFIFGTPQVDGSFPAIANLVSTNSAISGIVGTDTGGSGFVRFEPIASDPKTSNGGFQDVTMLSYWGAIVFDGSNAGFAMEFIGDLNDSAAHPAMGSGVFPSGVN